MPHTGSISIAIRNLLRGRGHGHCAARTILAPMTQERRPKTKPTEDRKLLRSAPYADASFLDTDAWRALRIQGEVIEGFDSLARLGIAVSIFGSARTHPD